MAPIYFGDNPKFARQLQQITRAVPPEGEMEIRQPSFEGTIRHHPPGQLQIKIKDYGAPRFGLSSGLNSDTVTTIHTRAKVLGEPGAMGVTDLDMRIDKGAMTVNPSPLFAGKIFQNEVIQRIHKAIWGEDPPAAP